MSRTTKWEHRTDSFHDNHRIERKSRPAGRLDRIIAAELEEVEDGIDNWTDYLEAVSS